MTPQDSELYIGIDLGGTNVSGALVDPAGGIVARVREDTPRNGSPADVLEAICGAITPLVAAAGRSRRPAAAIGLGVPGLVDPDRGVVIVAPNVGKGLSGQQMVDPVEKRFGIACVLGNDANVAVMGECWLGASRGMRHVVGLTVGTGVGGGLVVDGRLVTGANHAAGEIGHMIVQLGGPKCGCGSRGCLEALASRTAIEKRIREAVRDGQKTVLTDLLDGDLSRIRSKALRKALRKGDPLTVRVVSEAARCLGLGCMNISRILAPEAIVLAGGVIEACGDFVMPLVREVFESDPLAVPGARCRLLASELGDDAGVLGAAALARDYALNGPADTAAALPAAAPGAAPRVGELRRGEVVVGGHRFETDIWVRADGTVRKRKKAVIKRQYGTSHTIGVEEVRKVCKGGARTLVVGTGQKGKASLNKEAERYLKESGVEVRVLPSPDAAAEFNRAAGPKALVLHVKC